MDDEAEAVELAGNVSLDEGIRTKDMKSKASTKEMGASIMSLWQQTLDKQHK